MEQYPTERHTNIMSIRSYHAFYTYIKPTIQNCKCTFIDGTVYWQKMIFNNKFYSVRGETDKLYLDKNCTLLADVTRKEKIEECKHLLSESF